MQWLSSFLVDLLAKLIPWLFSGSKTKGTGHTDGLEGLDRGSVTGLDDLRPEELPDL
jgi:hypothetical protein